VHEALADEADLVAELVHDLARGVERALRKHGRRIVDRQYVQERLANAAIDLYVASATLARATAELEAAGGDETAVAAQLDCVRIFVPMAFRRARRQLRGLQRNQDERLDAIAARAIESGDLAPPAPRA
jgi:acyl-CoA dehydrogenase family protein 9